MMQSLIHLLRSRLECKAREQGPTSASAGQLVSYLGVSQLQLCESLYKDLYYLYIYIYIIPRESGGAQVDNPSGAACAAAKWP